MLKTDRNGYEAYRRLSQDWVPNSRSRVLSLLHMLGEWPVFEPKQGIHMQLNRVGDAMLEYETISGTSLSENQKLATLLRCLTGQLRSHCNLAVTGKTTYNELRAMILRYDAADQLQTVLRPWMLTE